MTAYLPDVHSPKLGRRGWFAVALGVLSVPVVGAALAYGCTALATLSVSPGAAPAGSTVTVTGSGFGTHDATRLGTNGPAEVRFGSVTGPVLATASPAGPDKSFKVQITIPRDAAPGETLIVATQKDAAGRPVYGTPARRTFTVTQAPGRATAGSSVAPPGGSGTPALTDANQARRRAIAKARRRAVSNCRKRHSTRKATTTRGKRRIARRRAACIRRAKARYRLISSVAPTAALDSGPWRR